MCFIFYPAQFVEVGDQVWSVTVDKATESQTILPAK